MLQVNIDPSLLVGLPNAEKHIQLTTVISGVIWAGDSDSVPAVIKTSLKGAQNVQNVLYPWQWPTPEKLRIYWLRKEGESYSLIADGEGQQIHSEIDLIRSDTTGYNNDIDSLVAFYGGALDDKLWSRKPNEEFDVFQLIWQPGNTSDQQVTLDDQSETPNAETGFLLGAIANFSQKIPPLNQYLNLTFFGEDIGRIEVPENALAFVVFPLMGDWWRIGEEARVEVNDQFATLIYQPSGRIVNEFTTACFITNLKEELSDVERPIKLRDAEGNFDGYVALQVSDAIDPKVENEENEPVNQALKNTFNTPPSLQIQVDKLNLANENTTEDDLSDEIAGNIVLMQRANKLNANQDVDFTEAWRYLNWARIKPVPKNKQELPALENSYLIPAFLPDAADKKMAFLELSNEKLSLIAGHDTFTDPEPDKTDLDPASHFQYEFDTQKLAYALWYGFHYRFAGFVTLNSGVLPIPLRKTVEVPPTSFWNIPADTSMLSDPERMFAYHHLRRVPVSKVRVKTRRSEKEAPLPLPESLLPLAFELPEWKRNNKVSLEDLPVSTDDARDEQVHYLLFKGRTAQESLTIELRKPTTSFLNWYAWLGNEANQEVDTGGGKMKSLKQLAFENELVNREKAVTENQSIGEEHLVDPAVHRMLCISVEQMFPQNRHLENSILDIGDGGFLSDSPIALSVVLGMGIESGIRTNAGKTELVVAEGAIIQVRIYALVEKKYFQEGHQEQKFHSWMEEVTKARESDVLSDIIDFEEFIPTHPVEIWFEGAKPSVLDPKTLWQSLLIEQNRDNVTATIEKTPENYMVLAYTSRLEISHQIWNWNGRQDESGKLLKELTLDPNENTDFNTTQAMEWEAWAFSDRPDFSALVHETNLMANRLIAPEASNQLVFTDHRPGEEKALYYRFAAIAYSRYELLGDEYVGAVESGVDVLNLTRPIKSKWRRFLRKCSRTQQLPKPSIRFVIPLTKSIRECGKADEIVSAPLLVVLNDRWFSEAGLAEQLELGIEITSSGQNDDQTEVLNYLNAGNDPILTGESLAPVVKTANTDGKVYPYVEKDDKPEGGIIKNPVAVFEATGPVGMTFDFAAQTPKLVGSSFVVEVPPLTAITTNGDGKTITQQLKPWSFIQIAVRRTLRPELCESGVATKPINSDWTAKEWVQFLPAIDSFIPTGWRKETAQKGFISIKKSDTFVMPDGTVLPTFDETFEEFMQRFVIVTETVYDLGGQPCEKYLATYQIEKGTNNLKPDNKDENPKFPENKEGYIRILLVRISKQAIDEHHGASSIWTRLFGDAAVKPDFKTVQNDPTAALPLVSERIPFRVLNL